jgi:hypothetical protein
MKFRAYDKTKARYTENHDNLAITFNGDIIFIDNPETLKKLGLITERNDLEVEHFDDVPNIKEIIKMDLEERTLKYTDEFYNKIKDITSEGLNGYKVYVRVRGIDHFIKNTIQLNYENNLIISLWKPEEIDAITKEVLKCQK